ncbi:BTB/POZ domain-containing protein 6-like [Anneissia japonica]|uniref:BTB/POZ domain-containing protein 6-like n=1 Tax=Anneissia japonica TaxID=1529436 RepID=UPI0014259765|nr:BTB/POZ domain-containing protein 6-like [Anneissia japonica]XP_033106402.1 BTB/POZ domain-containing protein 6-like [Anneissia japonica]XP_033106403.1 BTB/POZ domain-containing protein 6-like [Anneissia japonica]
MIKMEQMPPSGGADNSPVVYVQEFQQHVIQEPMEDVTEPAQQKDAISKSKPAKKLPPPVKVVAGVNWQASTTSVRGRNSLMYDNKLMSDVMFLVGPKNQAYRIPAHKYVLCTGSSVFYAMFYGELTENTSEIVIPDVEPVAFYAMLRYLYCDEVDVNADNVLSTLYAAKKYFLPHLATECVNFLETNLTARNACFLLSQSHLFDEEQLMQQCWEVIDAQTEVALRADSFVDIDFKTLQCILSRETLNVKEVALFHAAVRWAKAECKRQELIATPPNLRKVLGKAIYLIRIPTMLVRSFANEIANHQILTLKETNDVFLYFTADKKPNLEFPVTSRKGLQTCSVHRFQSSAYRSNQWRYRGRCDSIQFSVDRRIFIAGFGLYGSSTNGACYAVRIELKRNKKTLSSMNTRFVSDGSNKTFPIMFEHPIQVEPRITYTANAILDGTELSFFGQEGLTDVACGCATFTFQCSSESTNGTGVQGGQLPEIIFYA